MFAGYLYVSCTFISVKAFYVLDGGALEGSFKTWLYGDPFPEDAKRRKMKRDPKRPRGVKAAQHPSMKTCNKVLRKKINLSYLNNIGIGKNHNCFNC